MKRKSRSGSITWVRHGLMGLALLVCAGGSRADRVIVDLMGTWHVLKVEAPSREMEELEKSNKWDSRNPNQRLEDLAELRDLLKENEYIVKYPTGSPPESVEGDSWVTFQAPGRFNAEPSGVVWMLKEVDVPDYGPGWSAVITLESVVFGCRLFVNGQECGSGLGGYSPLAFDVTKALRKGRNQIALGLVSLKRYPEFLRTGIAHNGGGLYNADHDSSRSPWPSPTTMGTAVGLWQGARLEIVPCPAYVVSVFAKPSVRTEQLVAEVEIRNPSDSPFEGTVTIRPREADGSPVLDRSSEFRSWLKRTFQWPAQAIAVPPGQTVVFALTNAWKNPRLWWPHDPHLYHLTVELQERTSRRTDTITEPFGFREIHIEGTTLKLNGQRLIMRGGSFSRYQMVLNSEEEARTYIDRIVKGLNANAIRTHVDAPEAYFMQAADKAGVLLLVQPPYAAGASAIGEPEVWNALDEMYLRYIKRMRNHPSIAIWSTDNEAGGQSPANAVPAAPFLAAMTDKIRAVDGTRPVTSTHNFYLLGKSDFFDTGVGQPFSADNCAPRHLRHWQIYYFDAKEIYRKDKPWIGDEWGEDHNTAMGSCWYGDQTYRFPDVERGDVRSFATRFPQAHDVYLGMIEFRRWPQMAVCMPFGDRFSMMFLKDGQVTWGGFPEADDAYAKLTEYAQRSSKPAIVVPAEWNGGAWAGEPYERPLVIMNDHFFDLAGRLEWSVRDGQGRVLLDGGARIAVPAATHQDFKLSFTMPKSQEPTEWVLELRLVDRQGSMLYRDEHKLGVVPRPDFSGIQEVVVWPNGGTLVPRAGWSPPFPMRISTDLPEPGQAVVVVPRGADLTMAQWRALERWVAEGGALLSLADEGLPPHFLGARLRLTGSGAVIGHVRTPNHPVLGGISTAALSYWLGAAGEFLYAAFNRPTPEFLVAKRCLRRPDSGCFLTLVDAGRNGYTARRTEWGLSQAPLVELRGGKGRAIFSTLLLGEGLQTSPVGPPGEPGAVYLFHRCLAYLQDRSRGVGSEPRPLYALGCDLSPYGVTTTRHTNEAGAMIVNAASREGDTFLREHSEEWKAFLDQGKTVVFHNISTAQAEALSASLGVKLEAAQDPALSNPKAWGVHRLDWLSSHPLVAGLSHYDVNFMEVGGLSRLLACQQIMATSVRAEPPGINLTQPGALVVIPHGNGTVLIDQVLWDPTDETPRLGHRSSAAWESTGRDKAMGKGDPVFASAYIAARARGYISQLLANLGAQPILFPSYAGEASPTKETVLLFHFNRSPGGLVDSGPYGLDVETIRPVPLTEGRFGEALKMEPDSQYWVPDSHYLLRDTSTFTVDFWIRPEGTTPSNLQVILLAEANYPKFHLALTPSRRIQYLWINRPGGQGFIESKESIPANEWTRVTLVQDFGHPKEGDTPNAIRLYLNGQLALEHKTDGYYHQKGNIVIGASGPWRSRVGSLESFAGALDELHIVTRAWTARDFEETQLQ